MTEQVATRADQSIEELPNSRYIDLGEVHGTHEMLEWRTAESIHGSTKITIPDLHLSDESLQLDANLPGALTQIIAKIREHERTFRSPDSRVALQAEVFFFTADDESPDASTTPGVHFDWFDARKQEVIYLWVDENSSGTSIFCGVPTASQFDKISRATGGMTYAELSAHPGGLREVHDANRGKLIVLSPDTIHASPTPFFRLGTTNRTLIHARTRIY